MAGRRETARYTYKVNDASGVTQRRFVQADGTSTEQVEVKMPASADVFCMGIAAEDGDDDAVIGVWAHPGDIVLVDGDGTVAPGDFVTNDANGKGTNAENATPALTYVHGIAEEVNLYDNTISLRIQPMQMTI